MAPRGHNAGELKYRAAILGPDNTTRASGICAGVNDLSGKRLEQAQLISSETSHMIVLRYDDAATLDPSCYIVIDSVTYIVDAAPIDPRIPRPKMWLEVYCHVERSH